MPKTDGNITRAKILEVSELLFSKLGYDGTSIDKISKSAGINKATIYYHFKDKQDILNSLFNESMRELYMSLGKAQSSEPNLTIRDKMKLELAYMDSKRKILAIIFMEALKDVNTSEFLFDCADVIIKNELKNISKFKGIPDNKTKQIFYMHEFFTGIVPIMIFVILKDKWQKYFKCDAAKMQDYFLDNFQRSHLMSHIL